MPLITCCTYCKTHFKVDYPTLQASQGLVRCGRCNNIFDATLHLQRSGSQKKIDSLSTKPSDAPIEFNSWADETVSKITASSTIEQTDAQQTPETSNTTSVTITSHDHQCLPENIHETNDISVITKDATENTIEPDFEYLSDLPNTATLNTDNSKNLHSEIDTAFNNNNTVENKTGNILPSEDAIALDISATHEASQTSLNTGIFGPELYSNSTKNNATDISDDKWLSSTNSSQIEPSLKQPKTRSEIILEDPYKEPLFVVQAQRKAFWQKPLIRFLLLLSALVALLLLALQYALQNRDSIAAKGPEWQQAMQKLCAAFNCKISPLKDISELSVEDSDFKALGDNRYNLIWKIQNNSKKTLKRPALALTLRDPQGVTLFRRIFTPTELKAPELIAAQQHWQGVEKILIKSNIVTTQQIADYQIQIFYPH